MSAPSNELNPQQVQGHCSTCTTLISIPAPPINIFNCPTAAAIVIPHTQGVECPNCGTYHNLVVHPNTAIVLALVPMEKPELNEDRKIIPFTAPLKGLRGN